MGTIMCITESGVERSSALQRYTGPGAFAVHLHSVEAWFVLPQQIRYQLSTRRPSKLYHRQYHIHVHTFCCTFTM